jgi:homocysteine S-methyltransferase
VIVDGGLGVELARRGFAFSTTLWSAEAVLSRPDLLAAVHGAYLAAGAQVIETATYQLSHAALRALGYDDPAIDAVFARAVALARDAIAAQTHSAASSIVAGSLGPYAATLGDGAEYSGTRYLDDVALYAFHAERIRSMLRAGPDLILLETIPSRLEARIVAQVAHDLRARRVWISLTCADGARTYAGDRVSDVAAELDAFACVEVVGVNCTPAASIAPLVRAIASATAKPIMVCPNVGEHAQDHLVRRVPEWLALGVTHVGGCCGVGPSTIGAIARAVGAAQWNHDTTMRPR